MAGIDETRLLNKLCGKTWTCPHCGKRNYFRPETNDILSEFFKVIEQCRQCGALHIWKLELTEDFKQKVVAFIENGMR